MFLIRMDVVRRFRPNITWHKTCFDINVNELINKGRHACLVLIRIDKRNDKRWRLVLSRVVSQWLVSTCFALGSKWIKGASRFGHVSVKSHTNKKEFHTCYMLSYVFVKVTNTLINIFWPNFIIITLSLKRYNIDTLDLKLL